MAKISLTYLDPPSEHHDGAQPASDRAAPIVVERHRSTARTLAAGAVECVTNWVKALTGQGKSGLGAPSLQTVHRGIAREFNRARRFERPLSVLVVRADGLKTTGVDAAVHIALQRLRDTDIWFHDPENGELVLVAPETGRDAAQTFGRRVAAGLGAGRGAEVAWSTATFPADGLTFEGVYAACRERIARPIYTWGPEAAQLG